MPGPSRTPAQLRTRYHEAPATPALPVDPAFRPSLGGPARNPGEESEAFSDWLGHLAAGRIEVR